MAGEPSGGSAELIQPGQRRPAKLFHKKSRTGCQRCRARRVKCDEAKPVCSNCTRLSLTCVYDRAKLPQEGGGGSSPGSSSTANTANRAMTATVATSPAANTTSDVPESRARRKLELSLFYQYFTETGHSISVDETSAPFLVGVVAKLAFESDAVLYGVFVVAALHRCKKSNNTDSESAQHCANYLNMAIHELSHQIDNMSAANVDEVCITSSLLRIYTFVRLQDRDLEPYHPPFAWLRGTYTSIAVFRRAAELTADSPESVGVKMIRLIRHLLDERSGGASSRRHTSELIHLLRRRDPHELLEPWDDATHDAYLNTLNSIGGIWTAMRDGQPPANVARRLIVFPILVDQRFVDIVEEGRPRALVILAHYFALLSMLRGLWWIGDAGPREVDAIDAKIPPEWRPMLEWPRNVLKNKIVFTADMVDPTDQLSEYAAGLRLHR